MKAEDIDSARPKAFGDAFEMSPGRLFGQEVAERVDGAKSGVDRPGQAEIGHVGLEHVSPQPSPGQAAPQIVQATGDSGRSRSFGIRGRPIGHEPTGAAAGLKQPACRKGQYLWQAASIKSASKGVSERKARSQNCG